MFLYSTLLSVALRRSWEACCTRRQRSRSSLALLLLQVETAGTVSVTLGHRGGGSFGPNCQSSASPFTPNPHSLMKTRLTRLPASARLQRC